MDPKQHSMRISRSLAIPLAEIDFHFSRSGGRGGQNVNKVETRVEVRWALNESTLAPDVRERLKVQLSGRLNSRGVLSVVADSSRSQWQNREEALGRLVEIVREALRPVKKRVASTRTGASRVKRIESKKKHGVVKSMRKKVRPED